MQPESHSRLRSQTLSLIVLALCGQTFFSPVNAACGYRGNNGTAAQFLPQSRSRVALTNPQKTLRTTKPAFDYAKQKIRGVNAGGWLLLEPFLSPKLFNVGNSSVIDEFTLSEALGKQKASQHLKAHWDSFYTEKDFQTMASYGLNHVRIPIGYWAFDISQGEPYVQGQYDYLLQAISWCDKAGLRVIVDLHGAPGSQNGYDHSGRKGPANWDVDQSNVDRTKAVIAILTKEFSQEKYVNVVVGIQVLNEPTAFKSPHMETTLRQFYNDTYDIVRNTQGGLDNGPETNLMFGIHDGFLPLTEWSNSFPKNKFRDVSLDTHIYTVFDQGLQNVTDEVRIKVFCDKLPDLEASQAKVMTFVGEFTTAPTDCAPHLNGIGIGSRYEGSQGGTARSGSCDDKSGPGAQFSDEYKRSLGKIFEIQTTVYERTSGWFMWSFKTESADDWSYDAGVRGGWIPKNLDEKFYGLRCN